MEGLAPREFRTSGDDVDSTAHARANPPRAVSPVTDDQFADDHFAERDGVRYAGTHLIVDLWGAQGLNDVAFVEATLREAAAAADATVLDANIHHFQPGDGVTGVLVLAESHISIHTWPEHDYAAIDVFMCGKADPALTVPVLRAALRPKRVEVSEIRRGVMR